MSEAMDAVLLRTAIWLKTLGIDGFHPALSKSKRWISWVTNFRPETCSYCAEQNGKFFEKYSLPQIKPPVHERCNCYLNALLSILTGTATIEGSEGADYWLKFYKFLSKNYVSKQTAEKAGWKSYKGNLRDVIQGASIGGDIYYNDKSKFPTSPGRIWYEADINYTGGYRNQHRLLYSNDGLLFVTYDHYETFYEVN